MSAMGSARTIVMIHGMWCRGSVWDNYRRFFDDAGYRCLTPTLRHHGTGFGEVPDPRLGSTSLRDYAADLKTLVGEFDEPPILMGHSMGALLARIVAARVPVRSLVLLTPAPAAGTWAILNNSVRQAFRAPLFTWSFWKKPLPLGFKDASRFVFNNLGPEEGEAVYRTLTWESGRAAAEMGLWFLDRGGASRVDPPRNTCPVLVVGAALDRITPVAIARGTAESCGEAATYREYGDFAHWVLREPGWERIAGDVLEWLSGQGLPGNAKGNDDHH
jgi:pimeloyl-ACP methyl ester carboxylesterase